MDLLASLNSLFGGIPGYIIPFIFVLSLVVFVHEMGHFLVARFFGVAVERFSIGFGREIFGWTDRHGTRWKVAWLPLGGYVKFAGDENAASAPDREAVARMTPEEQANCFQFKPLHARAAIVAAGPVANFILAIFIFAIFYMGQTYTIAHVDEVRADSPAAEAGFRPGDVVLEVDGTDIESFNDLQRVVSTSPGTTFEILVENGGEERLLTATPKLVEIEDQFGNTHQIGQLGISQHNPPAEGLTRSYGPIEAVGKGAGETWFIISSTMSYLGDIITGQRGTEQLSGPLGIAQVSGQVATLGLTALLNLAAVLSVSIGLINLFPVPMLDGGHLLYYAVEAVRGRPLGERAQEVGFRMGLAAVMILMVFATWNDLVRLQVVDFVSAVLS